MNKYVLKSTGIGLLMGALLAIVTMALHPYGGSIEQIIAVSPKLKSTHVLAIFSLPIILFGFYGITFQLKEDYHIAIYGFIVISLGCIAGIMAATINGLALPYFLEGYAEALSETKDQINPVINYSFVLNKAFDYIFITCFILGITIYSILILMTKKITQWLGWFGIGLSLFSFFKMLLGHDFIGLEGFRVFVFGITSWILLSGASLLNTKNNDKE